MPIGGAEDRRANRTILTRFVQICGSSNAHIMVIPSASGFAEQTALTYEHIFSNLGAGRVSSIHVHNRSHANEKTVCNLLHDVTGIFFTGGDQLRLLSLVGGTRMSEDIVNHFNHKGVHIGGTSAGASAMSRQMIAFGRSGETPSQRMVQMALGLGLTENLIIDQHFQQRNRLGRLMTAVALNPGLVGIGIDEDTAVMIKPDGDWEIMGSGHVTVVDSRYMEYTDIYAAKRYDQITVKGIPIQILQPGIISKVA